MRRKKLHGLDGLHGADVYLALADGARMAGEPFGGYVLDLAEREAVRDCSPPDFDGFSPHQRTALRTLTAALGRTAQARDENAMIQAALFGAMVVARVTEGVERAQRPDGSETN